MVFSTKLLNHEAVTTSQWRQSYSISFCFTARCISCHLQPTKITYCAALNSGYGRKTKVYFNWIFFLRFFGASMRYLQAKETCPLQGECLTQVNASILHIYIYIYIARLSKYIKVACRCTVKIWDTRFDVSSKDPSLFSLWQRYILYEYFSSTPSFLYHDL